MRLKPLPLDSSLVGLARLLAYPPGTWMEYKYCKCILVEYNHDYSELRLQVRGDRRRFLRLPYRDFNLRVIQ